MKNECFKIVKLSSNSLPIIDIENQGIQKMEVTSKTMPSQYTDAEYCVRVKIAIAVSVPNRI